MNGGSILRRSLAARAFARRVLLRHGVTPPPAERPSAPPVLPAGIEQPAAPGERLNSPPETVVSLPQPMRPAAPVAPPQPPGREEDANVAVPAQAVEPEPALPFSVAAVRAALQRQQGVDRPAAPPPAQELLPPPRETSPRVSREPSRKAQPPEGAAQRGADRGIERPPDEVARPAERPGRVLRSQTVELGAAAPKETPEGEPTPAVAEPPRAPTKEPQPPEPLPAVGTELSAEALPAEPHQVAREARASTVQKPDREEGGQAEPTAVEPAPRSEPASPSSAPRPATVSQPEPMPEGEAPESPDTTPAPAASVAISEDVVAPQESTDERVADLAAPAATAPPVRPTARRTPRTEASREDKRAPGPSPEGVTFEPEPADAAVPPVPPEPPPPMPQGGVEAVPLASPGETQISPAPSGGQPPAVTPSSATVQRRSQAPLNSEPAQPTRGVGELEEAASSAPAPQSVEVQAAQRAQGPVHRVAAKVAERQESEPTPEGVAQPPPGIEATEDEEPPDTVDDVLPGAPTEAPRLPLQAVPLQEALFGGPASSVPTSHPDRRPVPEMPRDEFIEAQVIPAPQPVVQRLPLEEHAPTITPVREGGPLMQVHLVRRATEQEAAPAQGGTPAQAGATPARAHQPSTPAEPDLDRLAEEVYRRLRERLRVERERHGRSY